LESRLNSFRVNRLRRLDFPTPESPINTTAGSQCQQRAAAGRRARRGLGDGR
jgi:hypothetical protein